MHIPVIHRSILRGYFHIMDHFDALANVVYCVDTYQVEFKLHYTD